MKTARLAKNYYPRVAECIHRSKHLGRCYYPGTPTHTDGFPSCLLHPNANQNNCKKLEKKKPMKTTTTGNKKGRPRKTHMRMITLNLPEPYIQALANLVKEKYYPNRAEAIRTAIRDLLMLESWGKRQ